MGWLKVWAGGLFAMIFVSAGCGSSTSPRPQWTVFVAAGWNDLPTTTDQVGYSVSIQLESYGPTTSSCPAWSGAMQLQVNGQETATTVDDTGCLVKATLGPALKVDPISIDLLDGAVVVAHGEFDDLAPGTKATLVMPADGTFHAGDDILVVPPPELPTGFSGLAVFYPLDPNTWSPTGKGVAPQRLADGLHVTAPALAGRAALTFDGRPFGPMVAISCTGFALCNASANSTVGPVLLVGAP
jgi:hypothetical protein